MGAKKPNGADVSRRGFLKKGAAAGVGAGALADLGLTDMAAQGNAQRRWDVKVGYQTLARAVEIDKDLMLHITVLFSPEQDPDDQQVWM